MNIKVILLFLILFGSVTSFSKNNPERSVCQECSSFIAATRIINANDSVIFDLANATLTATYIDIPIYIVSDDAIFGLDYAMQFTQAKLTFSSTVDLVPWDSTFNSFSYFNPSDLFLRYSGSTFQNFTSGFGAYLTKIRFVLSAPCTHISAADFTNITTLLNGVQCSYRITSLNFAQFIPSANFNHVLGCTNSITQFSDQSTVSNGTVAAWQWNFGNGSSSTLQNPQTTYTVAGPATATLIVSSNSGCSDTVAKQLIIYPTPIATINPAGTVTFCPISSVTLNGPTNMMSYLWSNSATTKSISVSVAAIYSLKVTDSNGCSATSLQVVVSNGLPSDFNKNGTVDIDDFLLFAPKFGLLCSCPEDLNGDGIVDIIDFIQYVPSFNTSCQ